MKIISLNKLTGFTTILLGVLLSPIYTSAQVVGGGGTQTYSNTPTNSNLLEDDFFSALSIGAIIPEGLFGQQITNPFLVNSNAPTITLPFQGQSGLGATTGFNLGFSGFGALSKFQVGPSSTGRFGLLFGFDFGYIPLNWSTVDWSSYDLTLSTSAFFYTGLKFGPQLYINPMENMGIGIYATIDPYLTIPGGVNGTLNYTDPYGDNTDLVYSVSDTSSIHLNINVSLGINFYYKALIIGIEYNWIHTKYNGDDKETGTYYEAANNTTYAVASDYHFSNVIDMNMLKLTIGIRFGSHPRVASR